MQSFSFLLKISLSEHLWFGSRFKLDVFAGLLVVFFPSSYQVENILVVFNYHRVALVATCKLQAHKDDVKIMKWFWKTLAS